MPLRLSFNVLTDRPFLRIPQILAATLICTDAGLERKPYWIDCRWKLALLVLQGAEDDKVTDIVCRTYSLEKSNISGVSPSFQVEK